MLNLLFMDICTLNVTLNVYKENHFLEIGNIEVNKKKN